MTRTRILLAALLAVLAAGAGAVLVRRRRAATPSVAGPSPSSGTVSQPPSEEPAAEAVEQEWSCECGQEYRVSGQGIHRVYWVKGASVSDPVMDGRCPNCERALPGERAA